MSNPLHARLADGRLHLQHGPIDCIVEAWGRTTEVEAAYVQAVRRFQDVLAELVTELPALRAPMASRFPQVQGSVARRMVAAVWPYREVFITPMAAVAGSVADELLAALKAGRELDRAYVNNGGDIALHLAEQSEFQIGVVTDPGVLKLDGGVKVRWADPVRGVATSGWRGRSQSLGIADAVTILAGTAAAADAAATLVANAVNVEHPSIRRLPAREVKEDSDLGNIPVTVGVGPLPLQMVEAALEAGARVARTFRDEGRIEAAYLALNGRSRMVQAIESGAGSIDSTIELSAQC